MNIKQLKEFIKDLPDNMPVVSYSSDFSRAWQALPRVQKLIEMNKGWYDPKIYNYPEGWLANEKIPKIEVLAIG